jgi:HD-like signal output (HDOD) protein
MGVKRMLFVDDEAAALKSLDPMLRSQPGEWDVACADTSEKALAMLKAGPSFDVVVTEVGKPHIDGIEVLRDVRTRAPESVRLILSANRDAKTMMHASTIAHQFLHKPCDPQALTVLIIRALALRDHLRDGPLKAMLHELGALPSMPARYQEVVAEINSPDPTVAKVAEIIEKDVAMSAKVLQIVNSAFVGLNNRVANVTHAVSLLGLDNVRNMVLLSGIFFAFDGQVKSRHASMEALWSHSLEVARCAMTIAREESGDREAAFAAFTAGLLHDVGLLVLSARLPDKLDQAFEWARQNGTSIFEGEREIFGATHAQVGGYLLELWGLPDSVTEAVAYHDYPSAAPESLYETPGKAGFPPLAAVHVANYFRESGGKSESNLDEAYLARLKLLARVDAWWQLCQAA